MTLPVTTEMIERTATALATGGWSFTPRQLYYATCAAAEAPPSASTANGAMALGALLALVALILIHVPVAFVALLVLAGLLILAGAIARLTLRPLPGRPLAISFAEFQRLLAGLTPPGLVDPVTWTQTPAPGAPILVCDTADAAAAVGANLARAELEAAVQVAAHAASLEGASVTALHDASPRGCSLPLELRDARADVLDAGLRPRWVDDPAFQVLEGAPARLPRDLSPLLDDDEIGWLASGRRVELAVLPPERLMRLVRAALAERKAHPDATGTDAPGLLPSLPALP